MPPPRGTFRLTTFDEGGVRTTDKASRLVCILEGGRGKLAIWGGLLKHPTLTRCWRRGSHARSSANTEIPKIGPRTMATRIGCRRIGS